jgi:formate hydrogenlyase transcriptional activator
LANPCAPAAGNGPTEAEPSPEEEIQRKQVFGTIAGHSPSLERVFEQIETVAPTDSSVLILGETGTGNELIATAIHGLTPRRDYRFVTSTCASIPTGLLACEFFGREKRAFTGAITLEIGRVELANGGALIFDEEGDILLELQSKLLRVL